jgi:hypothetical protein
VSSEKKLELMSAVASLEVEIVDVPFINCESGERQACTYPELKKTSITQAEWVRIENQPLEQMGLIAHELLRLVDLQDGSYGLSSIIAERYLEQVEPLNWNDSIDLSIDSTFTDGRRVYQAVVNGTIFRVFYAYERGEKND